MSARPVRITGQPNEEVGKMRALRGSILGVAIVALLLWPTVSPGRVGLANRGHWPSDWPKELEPLRERSKTIGVGTGLQETIYQIPFDSRAEFEKVWSVLLKLKSRGGTLTIERVGTEPADRWPGASNEKPCVRIYGPTDSHVGVGPGLTEAGKGAAVRKEDLAEARRLEVERLVSEGQMLRASPPWPKDLYDDEGRLAEWVSAERDGEGQLRWVRASRGGRVRGFLHRARVDVQIVVDGDVIDLNRIPLPPDTPIIDRRWEKAE
jgi:hypothetical protein